MTASNPKPETNKFAKYVGLLFCLLSSSLAIVIKCASKTQLLGIYILFGVGLSLLFSKSADKTFFQLTNHNYKAGFFGTIAVPLLLIFLNPVAKYDDYRCKMGLSTTTLTVSVRGKNGFNDVVIRNQGSIILNTVGEIKSQPINEAGQATFAHIPLGATVQIGIQHSEPYLPLRPDSEYQVTENANIFLYVTLIGIDNIAGKVLFRDSFLKGVQVSIDLGDTTLNTTTNDLGTFRLTIPERLQAKSYDIWLAKPGYKTTTATIHPQTGLATIVMETK